MWPGHMRRKRVPEKCTNRGLNLFECVRRLPCFCTQQTQMLTLQGLSAERWSCINRSGRAELFLSSIAGGILYVEARVNFLHKCVTFFISWLYLCLLRVDSCMVQTVEKLEMDTYIQLSHSSSVIHFSMPPGTAILVLSTMSAWPFFLTRSHSLLVLSVAAGFIRRSSIRNYDSILSSITRILHWRAREREIWRRR